MRIEHLPGSWEEFDEKTLTIAFKAGDQSAYRSIYTRFESRVNYLCRRMLSDRDDAAEATQETFLRVYQGLERFNGQYKLGAWITRIATNVCLDQIRTRQRKPVDATPIEVLALDPPVDAIEDGPEETVIRLSETRRVRRVLKQLPPMHRAAIVLRDFEGLRYCEIADILEITDIQVKALIHRARQNFKRSWTAGLSSLFISTRLAPIRKLETPVRDQATGVAATQATDVATSAVTLVGHCGVAVQTCGQFMSDRAAAIITAAMVGTAAAGGGIIAGAHESKPEHRSPRDAEVVLERAPDRNGAEPLGSGSSSEPSIPQDRTGPSEAPAGEDTEPVAETDPLPPPPVEPAPVEPPPVEPDLTDAEPTESEETGSGTEDESLSESEPPPAEHPAPPPETPAADPNAGEGGSIEAGSGTAGDSPNQSQPPSTGPLTSPTGDTGESAPPTAGD